MFSDDYRAVKPGVGNGPGWMDRSYTLIFSDRKSVKVRFIFRTLESSGRKRACLACIVPVFANSILTAGTSEFGSQNR